MSSFRARSRSKPKEPNMRHEGIQKFPPQPPKNSQQRMKDYKNKLNAYGTTSQQATARQKMPIQQKISNAGSTSPIATFVSNFSDPQQNEWPTNSPIDTQMDVGGIYEGMDIGMDDMEEGDIADEQPPVASTSMQSEQEEVKDSASALALQNLGERYAKIAKEIAELPKQMNELKEIQFDVENFYDGVKMLMEAKKNGN